MSGSQAPDVTELRLGDLLTFLAVARSSSLTAAARERRVTPSQVSKALGRVEAHFGKRLVDRGSRGIALSDAGRRIVPSLETIVGALEAARASGKERTHLTLGAPSYVQAALLPVIAAAVPGVRVSAFALPPQLLRANAQDELYELLLVPGKPGHLPASWESEVVGEVHKALFGSPALAHGLGPGPIDAHDLADIPFICPVYRRDGRTVPTNDDCPLPLSKRRVGHEVQTFLVGLEVAAATNQLVFGPAVAAQHHLRSGALVEIEVKGWDVRDPLSFACHVDRVSVKNRNAIAQKLRSALAAMK